MPDMQALQYSYPPDVARDVETRLMTAAQRADILFVVLDDDPTGGQTVHDVNVYTSWEGETLLRAFVDNARIFYIMTNSRSMTEAQTIELHREIAKNLEAAHAQTGRRYEVISRGDSTLRGHYPQEPDTLRAGMHPMPDTELLIPFFGEGGRLTAGDIHYVCGKEGSMPVGETEFAQDRSFGFKSSHLGEWIAEKRDGASPAVRTVPLELLRSLDMEGIAARLEAARGGSLVVNATCYTDLQVFALAYHAALEKGRRFLARTAASWSRVVAGIQEIPLLHASALVEKENPMGGLLIAGSHVGKTTRQLEAIQAMGLPVFGVELNQHLVLQPEAMAQEVQRVASEADKLMAQGKHVVVQTRRQRLDLEGYDAQAQLELTGRIAASLVDVVQRLTHRPRFLVAKGGITSSDIAVKALGVRRALILGQAAPGVPVWLLGEESRWPGLAYVVFPGNVGDDHTLANLLQKLCEP